MEFHRMYIIAAFCFVGLSNLVSSQAMRDPMKGAFAGKLTSQKNNAKGDVYAVDENTLCIDDFHYDGTGRDVTFWIETSGQGTNSRNRFSRLRNRSSLTRYQGQNLLLKMPEGITIPKGVKRFIVWSRSRQEKVGEVVIPRSLDVPQMRVLSGLSPLKHEVRSGNITIVDSRTMHIPSLFYDGLGPDAFFWVGQSPTPDYKGIIIPNEKGTKDILTAYNGESISLRLPKGMTWYDVNYLSVWCREFRVDFGNVLIPDDLWVPPFVGL